MSYTTGQTDTFSVHTITYLTVSSGLRASHSDAAITRRKLYFTFVYWVLGKYTVFSSSSKAEKKRGHNSGNYRLVTVLICNLCSVLMYCRQGTVTFRNMLVCMFALSKATPCGMCQDEILMFWEKENHLRRQPGTRPITQRNHSLIYVQLCNNAISTVDVR